jgi:hypothetical protein
VPTGEVCVNLGDVEGRAANLEYTNDLRWASRLDGIDSAETFANPAKAEVFAVTKLLLEAGLQLRDEGMEKGDGGSTHGLSRVTRDKVVSLARALRAQRDLRLGAKVRTLQGAFNERWPQVDRFRRDVIIFELYARRWREELEASRRHMMELVDDLDSGRLGGADFIRAIVRLDAAVRSRFMRHAIAQAGLAMEPAYKELATRAHAEFLAEHSDEWIAAYRVIQDKCGINLRPGVTLDKAFKWIAWLVQSGAVEANVAGTDTSDLVAEGLMTMLAGLVDPGDNRSGEAFVNDRLSPTSKATEG